MDWCQYTWSMTAVQFLLSPASDISGLLTRGHCSCQGRRQHWGWGVLRSLAPHTSGTVCQLPFEPQHSRLWRSLDISRPICFIGTDSTSENYLGRALQICASSSSSSVKSHHCHLMAKFQVNICSKVLCWLFSTVYLSFNVELVMWRV